MEWFGITQDGPQDPFKDMKRDDYNEPIQPLDLITIYEQSDKRKSFPELMAPLDCYIGHVDGYAYRSYDRLIKMRKKGLYKPVGPTDMYRYPGTNFMRSGWWISDDKVTQQRWCTPITKYRRVPTDVTRYFSDALLIERCFKL